MVNNKIFEDLICINTPQMDNNTYLILKDKKVVIVDPSFAADKIINTLDNSYKVVGILLTHCHFDHCFDVAKLLKVWNCPVFIHKEEKDTYEKYNCADWVETQLTKFDNNIHYFTGKEIIVDDFKFQVTLTPGHTQGGVCYRYNNYVFVGDTLFFDSCGRTDLINSNSKEMVKSLSYLWSHLKDEDYVCCGHGRNGRFAEFKEYNYVVNSMVK